MNMLKEKLEEIIQQQCLINQVELWGLEISLPKGKKGIIRVYADKKEGINIDELAKLSRDIEVVLDIEEMIPNSYVLEVSSPGLNRKFFKPEQLTQYLGQEIKVKLKTPLNKRKVIKGNLKEVKENIFTIDTGKENIEIDFFETEKINLEYKF